MTAWNVTVDDTSPIFAYQPYADGISPSNGWSTYFTQTGYNKSPGQSGNGKSMHVTSLPNASVKLQFYGTGIYLYGQTNCSYDATLDNAPYQNLSPNSDVLYSQTGLDKGTHTVTLTAHPSGTQQLAFDYAVITTELGENETSPTATRIDNANLTQITYSTGQWFNESDAHIPTPGAPSPYHETRSQGATATMKFNGTGIAINGVTNWGHWVYGVTLDGQESTFNSSGYWFIPDTVLFYQGGLSVSQEHTVQLISTSTDGIKLSLNAMTIYGDPAESPGGDGSARKHSSKAGVIAGSVIGALALIGLISVLVWWLSRRRARQPAASSVKPDLLERKSERDRRWGVTPFLMTSDVGFNPPHPHEPSSPSSFVNSDASRTARQHPNEKGGGPSTSDISVVQPFPHYASANPSQTGYSASISPSAYADNYAPSIYYGAAGSRVSAMPSQPAHGGPLSARSEVAGPESPIDLAPLRRQATPPLEQQQQNLGSTTGGQGHPYGAPLPPPPQVQPRQSVLGFTMPDVNRIIELIVARIDRPQHQDDPALPAPPYRG